MFNKLITFILFILAGINGFTQIISDTAITSTDSVIHIYGVIKKPIVNQNNIVPTVNAGADKSITLPVSTVQLVGTASDADGSITKYQWSRFLGTVGGTIVSPNSATTNITNLTTGTYVFTLTVTDNSGATGSDNVMVMVNPAPPNNQSPTANAGTDKSLILPNNSIDITGTGTDADGTIAGYVWTKIAGPSTFTLTNSNTSKVTVSNLIVGTYVFRLTVTDNQGASGTDDVSVTVSQLTPPPTFNIEGYGSGATGGTGFQTIHITNLSQLASNIGSNRILLIDVSGTINTGLSVTNISNLTIDAYSTQQDVTITNGNSDGLTVENSINVIIRGLRSINNTGGANSDGFNATGSSSNVVFDHCSAYGNTDGNIDLTATSGKNFTVQWCIMGNDKQSGNMLITTINASIHHNLFIGDGSGEGAERNPFAHSRYSPVGPITVDFRNNLVNAAGRYASGTGWNATGNFIKNYYTSNKSGLISFCSDAGHCGSGYVSGNFNQPASTGGTQLSSEIAIPSQYQVTTTDAVTAGKAVLQNVGPYKKTSYEQGVINSITISSNPTPQQCTGYIYSDWGVCNNGTQSRTIIGTSPNGCTGTPTTSPDLTRTCTTPIPDTTTNYPGYTKVFSDYFNKDSDLDPDGNNQYANGFIDYNLKYEGAGSFASRTGNVSSGIRSEVQLSSAHSPKEGLIVYYANYQNFFSNSGHSFQFHPSNNGSGNGFYHVGGKLVYRNVTSGTDTYKDYPFNYTPSLNVWHKFEIFYKLGTNGYMKVYVDGVLYVNVSGVQIGDLSSYFIKLGVNMWIQQTSNISYDKFDVYRIN